MWNMIYLNYTGNMPFAYLFYKSVKLRQSFQIIWTVIYNTHDLTITYIGRWKGKESKFRLNFLKEEFSVFILQCFKHSNNYKPIDYRLLQIFYTFFFQKILVEFVLWLCIWPSLLAQLVRNPPARQETWVWSLDLDWKDAPEKGMAIHSSILAWRIPRTEEPGGLQSMGSQRVRHNWLTLSLLMHDKASTWCYWSSFLLQFSSVQSLSLVWLFATPWIAARQASLSITNSRSLLKLMSIESVMPSSHLILCRPLLLLPPILPSIRVFSNESALHMRWPKYWSFSFSISPSNEHPGLISFRMDWLLRAIISCPLWNDCRETEWRFRGKKLS